MKKLVIAAATAAFFAISPLAHAGDGDIAGGVNLSDLADLEALARQVERDGFKDLDLEAFSPGLPKGLRFQAPGDEAFRTKWKETYVTLCRAMLAELQGMVGVEAKQEGEKMQKAFQRLLKGLKKARKKDEAAQGGLEVLEKALPRVNELIEQLFGDPQPDLMQTRKAALEVYKKRFELGKTETMVTLNGTADVDVKIANDKWQQVVGEVGSWRFKPLGVTLGGANVEFAKKLRTSKLRASLRDLTYLEYFSLRFSRVAKIGPGGAEGGVGETIEIVGARLLFGFYYFIRYDDKLVVVPEPKPVKEPN